MANKVREVKFMPTQPKLLRVAAYARVSDGKDTMLNSLSAQVSHYSEYIQSHPGWVYCGVYSDAAKTGTTEKREGFQQLIARCRAGEIDLVITKSISRFARNTVTLLSMVRELSSIGVEVFFERENLKSMSGDGELMLSILASFAQEESRSASENQRWRIRKNFEEGKSWNGTVLGYRLGAEGYEIIPDEAEIVRFVFGSYLAGAGATAIAKTLNTMNCPTRKGGQWQDSTVRKMLRNDLYTGDLLLQKTFREDFLEKRMKVNCGELPMYQVGQAHEPIIPKEVFSAVQEELERRSQKRSKTGKSSPFTGIVLCSICGKKYRRMQTRKGHAWVCTTYNAYGKEACPAKRVPDDRLHLAALQAQGGSAEMSSIMVHPQNQLVFAFSDGSEKLVVWEDPTRADSWSEEMRERARQVAKSRKENGNGNNTCGYGYPGQNQPSNASA